MTDETGRVSPNPEKAETPGSAAQAGTPPRTPDDAVLPHLLDAYGAWEYVLGHEGAKGLISPAYKNLQGQVAVARMAVLTHLRDAGVSGGVPVSGATPDTQPSTTPTPTRDADWPRIITKMADAFWRTWDSRDRPIEQTDLVRDFLLSFGIWLAKDDAQAKLTQLVAEHGSVSVPQKPSHSDEWEIGSGPDGATVKRVAGASREAAGEQKPRTCNRHKDCDAADAKAKAAGRRVDHCHDDCCEDCFGQ